MAKQKKPPATFKVVLRVMPGRPFRRALVTRRLRDGDEVVEEFPDREDARDFATLRNEELRKARRRTKRLVATTRSIQAAPAFRAYHQKLIREAEAARDKAFSGVPQ